MAAQRNDGLRTEYVEGELFVHDDASGTTHALNPSAAAVFELCDGVTSDEAIAEVIAGRTDTKSDVQLVSLALHDLEKAGLVSIVDRSSSEAPPMNRRQLIQRIGAGAAAIAALPVVEAVIGRSVATEDAAAYHGHPGYTPSPTTSRPTPSPTTRSPTPEPTQKPTPSPTTQNPTPAPTQKPTPSPTTQNPTPSPTANTREPTPSPTPGTTPEQCVRELISECQRLVRSRQLNRVRGRLLTLHLSAALVDIQRRRTRHACRHLRNFIVTVQFLIRIRAINRGHGQSLISRARRCRDLLGCGRRSNP